MNTGRTTVNLRGRLRRTPTGGVAVILALVTGVQGTAHAAVSPTPTKTMNWGSGDLRPGRARQRPGDRRWQVHLHRSELFVERRRAAVEARRTRPSLP